jgi:hypothetical protein
MKYWIFQNNQVLGPYGPEDLSAHAGFSAESLVCPEGRRGTSMGDWQRAGMIPDLSVALVNAVRAGAAPTVAAQLAPEPSLKDLAALGSLQEKMTMLETMVVQLQEGMRAKDSELQKLQSTLAGKESQSEGVSASLRQEADHLKAEAAQFKRKIAELEERVAVVNRLGETIERAVEAEKHVESDVTAHGATLMELTKELESLRSLMQDRVPSAPQPQVTPVAPSPLPAATPVPMPFPAPAPVAAPSPAAIPEIPLPTVPTAQVPSPTEPPSAVPPPALTSGGSIEIGALPSFGFSEPATVPAAASAPANESVIPAFPTEAVTAVPIASPVPMPMPDAGAPAPVSVADAAAAVGDAAAPVPFDPMSTPGGTPTPAEPAKGGRAKIFIIGGAAAVAALVVVFALKRFMQKTAPERPSSVAALPEVAAPAPAASLPALSTAPAAAPAAAPSPVVDVRQTAIETVKSWGLSDGRTVGQALDTLSPPSGNLPPWMAEPLANNRATVNYYAHGAPGSPTVAYEFEVDLASKTVVGRNAAAKSVLANKTEAPPPPPPAKVVKIQPKKKPAKAKPAAVKPASKEQTLDSLLGADDAPREAHPMPGMAASGGDEAAAPAVKPAKKKAAQRAAKAAAKAADAKPASKASDEALLDDLLKD